MRVYYFGCLGDKGHYYFKSGSDRYCDPPEEFPWPGYEGDGGLQPHPGYKQGAAKLHHKDGWTALAWWDMTVDTRPASCSVLFVDAELDLGDMLLALLEHFPSVHKRQGDINIVEDNMKIVAGRPQTRKKDGTC